MVTRNVRTTIRQGTLDERENYKDLQEWIIEALHCPVYEAWLKYQLLRGGIVKKNGQPLPAEKLSQFKSVVWQPRRWAWIDPRADVDGAVESNVGGGSDVTLSAAQYGSAQLKLTGTPSTGINLVFPSTPGQWVVKNNQGGSQNITAKTPTSGGATVVVPQGVTVILSSDGTDVVLASASGQASFRTVSITGVSGTSLTVSGGYTVGAILIEKNGGMLEPGAFTASNGATITLMTAAVSSDKFTVYAFSSFSVANAVKKSGDTMVGTLTLAADGVNSLDAATKQQVDAAAVASVGYGQTWQSVTRVAGTTYYNLTSKPIAVSLYWTAPANIQANLSVNGIVCDASSNSAAGGYGTARSIVPPGGAYVLIGSGVTIGAAYELR